MLSGTQGHGNLVYGRKIFSGGSKNDLQVLDMKQMLN